MVDEPNRSAEARDRGQESDKPDVPPGAGTDPSDTSDSREDEHRDQGAVAKASQSAFRIAAPWAWRHIFGSPNVWTASATVAIAFATTVYTTYAYRQLTAMNDTLSEIKKQTKAAQDQLAQQEYATRLDQRAWIEIEPIKPKPYKSTTELYIYELFPKNLGKSAARDIVVRADNVGSNRESIENTRHPDWIYNLQDKFLFGKFKNNPPLNGGTPVPSVLGPGTISPIPITYITQTPQVSPGGSAMVSEILGRIDYTDEFGVPHWIRYCFYPADAEGNLASCTAGNDEDRNPEIPPPLPAPKSN